MQRRGYTSGDDRAEPIVPVRDPTLREPEPGPSALPSPPHSPPAGWYPDPRRVAVRRYWDGAVWTAYVSGPLVAGTADIVVPSAATPGHVVVHTTVGLSEKSLALAVVLTLFFGPLGMLYATIAGGLVMLAANVVLGFLTFGLFLFVSWPIQLVWAIVAVQRHNERIRGSASAARTWTG